MCYAYNSVSFLSNSVTDAVFIYLNIFWDLNSPFQSHGVNTVTEVVTKGLNDLQILKHSETLKITVFLANITPVLDSYFAIFFWKITRAKRIMRLGKYDWKEVRFIIDLNNVKRRL